MKKKLLLVALSLLLSSKARCQNVDSALIKPVLSRLSVLGDSILKGSNDTVRLSANQTFATLFDSVINLKGSEHIDFHEVKVLSILTAPDNAFVVYNWMCQTYFPQPRYQYFGYLRTLSKTGNSTKLYHLIEQVYEDNQEREVAKTGADNWTGCVYYKILFSKYKSKTNYVLLGWAPHNQLSTRKLIESLSISNNRIQFGVPIFKTGGRPRPRLIFEYSYKATMSLNYNNDKKMIVFDNLSSSDPRPESKTAYNTYGPDMSYNGLKFEKGFWVLYKDIDIRLDKDVKGKEGEIKKLRITKQSN
ncbi:MAG: hypothetical protein ACKOX3_07550 [Bacteroidota bacterium]